MVSIPFIPAIPQPMPQAEPVIPAPTVVQDSEQAQAVTTYGVTADELRQFVERWERLQAEKLDITDQQKEVMAEAKARGYDTKVLKALITLRKADPDAAAEFEAVFEMYKEALGMG